jgi:hypothetical protein
VSEFFYEPIDDRKIVKRAATNPPNRTSELLTADKLRTAYNLSMRDEILLKLGGADKAWLTDFTHTKSQFDQSFQATPGLASMGAGL